MESETGAEWFTESGDTTPDNHYRGPASQAWPCPPAVRHKVERTADERDAWSTTMQTNIREEQDSRQTTPRYADARREIEAAIHRVQREGQSAPHASRTIIREVPTMPERILTWECRTCGPTIRQDSNGWHKCRLCGQDAVRRTWVRSDIQERRWKPHTGTRPGALRYGRPAGSIRGRA